MRMTGPVLDAPDVTALARFWSTFMGWEVRDMAGPRPGHPPGDGWAMIRPADDSTKIEIQFEEHFIRPVYPGAAGQQGMQIHLDIQVDEVAEAVAWAIDCGAIEAASQPEGRDRTSLRVMLDPAGHPFCLWS